LGFRIVRSAGAEARWTVARAWLEDLGNDREALVVAPTHDAGAELLRSAIGGRGAAFGWRRATLGAVAHGLALPALASQGLAAIGRLAREAAVARAVHALADENALGRYEEVAATPGFVQAMAETLAELRMARVDLDAEGPAAERLEPALRSVAGRYEQMLAASDLTDRAGFFDLAIRAAREPSFEHPFLGLPVLLLDVPVPSELECELVAALAARAGDVLATVPAGDERATAALARALDTDAEDADPTDPAGPASSLGCLREHLFSDRSPETSDADDSVTVFSAPGESRECVEIARRIHEHARDGIAFDRIAVLLRAPGDYRAALEEALARADVPAHFARGVKRPDPAGRAFLALLHCKAEKLSARRFAEYLSLGQVPAATGDGAPPEAPPSAERFVVPEGDVYGEPDPDGAPAPAEEEGTLEEAAASDPDAEAVIAGTLRVPRRWENLLVDAAVIGGLGRWRGRLQGLDHELRKDLEALDDPDDPAAGRIERDLVDLATLRDFALPLLDELDGLPDEATWGEWLERLGALATRALARSDRVLAVLAELAPMAPIGPVDLDEVMRILSRHLLEVTVPPAPARYGRVFVAPVEAARGLAFDVVFLPGLAERLFPRKISEDPMLLDGARRRIDDAGRLRTNDDRVDGERLALRLAAGAAREKLVLSFPRLDIVLSRPRVPSFYALEVRRAAEGKLPDFAELAVEAEKAGAARAGWPAPEAPDRAIDHAEYDLARLQGLLDGDPEKHVGAARYLVATSDVLARSLRFRARRWLRGWTVADGFVLDTDFTGKGHETPVPPGAREAIDRHRLDQRSFSPTALQNYAICPYRFFLYAVHRLAPREVPERIEEMDPLQRGSLVHDVQFQLFTRLKEKGMLPVRTEKNLEAAREVLDRVIEEQAKEHREKLAPAIPRVWKDGVESVRADLREWLRLTAEDRRNFEPWRFELSFGLTERRARDPHSVSDPVPLDSGIRLRGSIDLIERAPDGKLRVTDHKTGKTVVKKGSVIQGGESLQPVLYALAAEKLFPDRSVLSGRLFYCTAAGQYQEREVMLDDEARGAAGIVSDALRAAIDAGFLPALPRQRACEYCDYQVVCGTSEDARTSRKPRPGKGAAASEPARALSHLARLRETP